MKQADYGSWHSAISAEMLVAENVGLLDLKQFKGQLFHLQSRPQEGGRCVLVQHRAKQQFKDITPAPFNIRSTVHEYGGSNCVFTDDALIFSHFADQQLYRQHYQADLDQFEPPQPLTHAPGLRFADGVYDAVHNRLICVCEDHSQAELEASNSIVTIDLSNGEVSILVSGSDFYASPQLSPDASRLCWIQWHHPNMPWDGSELCLASITATSVGPVSQIAGGDDISVVQPQWLDNQRIVFVSDTANWWNLYIAQDHICTPLYACEAEFATPLWQLGSRSYCVLGDTIVANYQGPQRSGVCKIHIDTKQIEELEIDLQLSQLLACNERVYALAGSPTELPTIVALEAGTATTCYHSAKQQLGPEYFSIAQHLRYSNAEQQTCYAYFYPPQNPDYQAPPGQLPPLITKLHGGPTGMASSALSLGIQFWTSRGFAVVDVNYGGSSGFGRDYRTRLNGQWGVVDVADTIAAVTYLTANKSVNPKQCAIRGGSAGGYTTLAALTASDVFSAAASYYGIADVEALAADTHKFESRYCDKLIGPYPEARSVYQQRSPINALHKLNCPVIFFQGAEDKIVLPNQAEMMVQALSDKGIPVAYILFDNEQHGFRRAENIIRAFNAEWLFYARVFGFTLEDDLPAIEIQHLDA